MSERKFSDSADGPAGQPSGREAGSSQYGVSLLGPAVLTGVDTPELGGPGTRWLEDAVLLDSPSAGSRSVFAGSRAMMLLSAYPAETREAETGIVVSLRLWAAGSQDAAGESKPTVEWDSASNARLKADAGLAGSVGAEAVAQAEQYLSEVAELASAAADAPSGRAAELVRAPLEEALTLLGQDPKWVALALGLSAPHGVCVVEAAKENAHQRASREALNEARESVAEASRGASVAAPGAETWRSRHPIPAILLSVLWIALAVVVLMFRPLTLVWLNYVVAFALGLDAVVGLIAAFAGLKAKKARARQGSDDPLGKGHVK
ncbi:DUF308 domain-containing protein [Pseudoglutamicibacter albus]|uniref:DUF308 domain-containing protein n=1 Tax=Pseudoglutamicibacter cumminsii TaxID=156979 RepID=A0AAP4C9M2_9MICC|nr:MULTISPECIES: DUF308 domain-containing protein [Pseudoglutamicibacter]MDK6274281.1 DUF308 domain-containing protein [Pseudoglutamicibacter cumminsii]PKY81046.1 hypothetical protein CYJ35_01025 [Pseudoglutamicibacter albus]WIK84308.1 DUF308 domain-containing protein [Pseudoglutamicibacter albus]